MSLCFSTTLLPRESAALHYYKSNLHCHTTLSDGCLTPKEVKEFYREQGYSVLAITDHRLYQNHVELCDEHFLALAAYEVDLNEFGERGGSFSDIATYHINLFDTNPALHTSEKAASPQPEQRYGDIAALNSYIARMSELGFLVCYNHPYWSLQSAPDYTPLRGLWGMEIYNHGCEIDGLYGYHPQAYDEMLRSGQRLFCVATDDNHNRNAADSPLCDSFGGFTQIAAPDLSYQSIAGALSAGRFYSSTGPLLLELKIEEGELVVASSPVEKIYLHMRGRDCVRAFAAPNETICGARFPLRGDEGFIRVECRDKSGHHANSNAYFIDSMLAGAQKK